MGMAEPIPAASKVSAGAHGARVRIADPHDVRRGPQAAGVATITPYRDGPYLVSGPFELRDQDGNVIDVDRKTVALCRCGRSQIRPFCDGTHKVIGFRSASGLAGIDAAAAPGKAV